MTEEGCALKSAIGKEFEETKQRYIVKWKQGNFPLEEEYDTSEEAEKLVNALRAEGVKATIDTIIADPVTEKNPGFVTTGCEPDKRQISHRIGLTELKQLASRLQQHYKLPNIYLGGSQSPKSHHYPTKTSDIDLFSYFNTYKELEKYAKSVDKDTMELLTFVPSAGLAGKTRYKGKKVQLSISFCSMKPEKVGGEDDQILLIGCGCAVGRGDAQDLFGDEKEDCREWDFGTFESLLPGVESPDDLEDMLDCVISSEKLTDIEIETLRKLIEKKWRNMQQESPTMGE